MKQKQSGFYIIALMLIITFLAATVLRYSTQMTNTSDLQARKSMSNQAYFSALSGLEIGSLILNSPEIISANALEARQDCQTLSTNFAFAGSEVTLSLADLRDHSSRLTTSINSAAAVIPVQSIANFANQGRVVINREAIDYFALGTDSATCNGFSPCLL